MNEVKMPLSVILDLAKEEIEKHVVSCMETNSIPAEMMVYVIKDILLDVQQIKSERIANEFNSLRNAAREEK